MTRRAKAWVLATCFALAAGAAALYLTAPTGPPQATLEPDDPAVVAKGRQIYEAECAACHGDRLQGQPDWRQRRPDGRLPAPPHDEGGHTWHHPDAVLFALTKYGPAKVIGESGYRSDMPAYEGTLSDDEIVAVLSYIKSTWPAPIRQRHDQINAAARQR